MNATHSKLLIPEAMTQLMTHPELEPRQVQAANVSISTISINLIIFFLLCCHVQTGNGKWIDVVALLLLTHTDFHHQIPIVRAPTIPYNVPTTSCYSVLLCSTLQNWQFASFAAPLVRVLKQLFMMSQWAAIHPLVGQNPHARWVHFLCNYKHAEGPTRTWVSADR